MATAMIPAAAVVSLLVVEAVGRLRDAIEFSDDGRSDVYEQIWQAYGRSTEDAAVALAVAHLIVQDLRFAIDGDLPLNDGHARHAEEERVGAVLGHDLWLLA